MSQYLVLSRIKVQSANCVAGFTYGFPAITQFMGFTHALERKLSQEFEIAFKGCAVICHDYQLRIYKPREKANTEFIQSKSAYTFKPKFDKGKMKSPSIIEEGKMNLTASIVIDLSKELMTKDETIELFKKAVLSNALQQRLAGGTILSIGNIELFSASSEEQSKKINKHIKRLLIPGFVLQDRSEHLSSYYEKLIKENPEAELVDAWLDFSALKYQASPKLKENEASPTLETDADWEYLPKPCKGWLVPIMTGYKAISKTYEKHEIQNTRVTASDDESVKYVCYVEAVHSIGEWKSMHRVADIGDMIWKYYANGDWYLCKQKQTEKEVTPTLFIESETICFDNSALADL